MFGSPVCLRGQSSEAPAPEGQHYCGDENTERRNHYLDLAGIENYTARFEGCDLIYTLSVNQMFYTNPLPQPLFPSPNPRNHPSPSPAGTPWPELPVAESLQVPGARGPRCSPAPLAGHQRELHPSRCQGQRHPVLQISQRNVQG